MTKLMYALIFVLALAVLEPRLTDNAYITSVPVMAGVVNEADEIINKTPVEYVSHIIIGGYETNVVNSYNEESGYMQKRINECTKVTRADGGNIIYLCITWAIDDWLDEEMISPLRRIALTNLAAEVYLRF